MDAAVVGAQPMDAVWIDIQDEALAMRGLGSTQKLAVVPRQIVVISAAVAATREEIAQVERIVQASAVANTGVMTVAVGRRLVDETMARRSRRLLAHVNGGNER